LEQGLEDEAQFQIEPIPEKRVQTAKIKNVCQTSGGQFLPIE